MAVCIILKLIVRTPCFNFFLHGDLILLITADLGLLLLRYIGHVVGRIKKIDFFPVFLAVFHGLRTLMLLIFSFLFLDLITICQVRLCFIWCYVCGCFRCLILYRDQSIVFFWQTLILQWLVVSG